MPEISPFVSATMAMLYNVLKERLSRIKSGNLKADGTEQTLLEYMEIGRILGYVDLGNMQAADEVIIRQYMKVTEGGNYRRYAGQSYSGPQDPPILYIQPRESVFALKITLQQVTGPYRTYPHSFMREQ